MSAARARIHAMFNLDETGEQELNTRLDGVRTEVLAETDLLPKAHVVAWLVKKAREFRSADGAMRAAQADAIAALASKVARGAVRPNNLRMLPATEADFFQPGRTYTREHHGRTIEFLVRSVDTPPDSTWQVAFGFRRDEDGDWEPTDSDDLTGWTDTTNTTGENS
ncbi:hypothetical protein O3Q52_17205 [Streptomyces sp. ActVer]|uniref:hypothetical protein n=1 Tax=Streptomyces sp. ActVer TaxID=3014558 RepID=UPI0022B3BC3B|nr:hypothetical protein [Streptomyces sp. ActVer]MCZ4509902.1 hypothetical protein [Streptomyces sp. ActVer]